MNLTVHCLKVIVKTSGMMVFYNVLVVWFSLALISCSSIGGRLHNDPELTNRIPRSVKASIDRMVHEKLQRMLSTHFVEEHTGGFLPHSRVRRQTVTSTATSNNSTSNLTLVFSEWSEFNECSAKCGGGVQIRTRLCLVQNCTGLGEIYEERDCGTLPCVSGTYMLDKITQIGFLNITDAKAIQFYKLKDYEFFAYLTSTQIKIFQWDSQNGQYVQHQTISVTQGVAFDIMKTYPRVYLVILEKSYSVFAGRYSRMYYYDPFTSMFQTSQPVTFEVWEPSAIQTFDVFGVPFMAITNYQNKARYFSPKTTVVCNGMTSELFCQLGSVISIQEVFYGRTDNHICSTGGSMSQMYYFNWCAISGVKSRIATMCDSKSTCSVTANPAMLVNYDQCPTTQKYLTITYTCERISYMGPPIFYKWDGIGLSVVSGENLLTYGAKDVEAFSIHNQQYVAVANYIDDYGSHHIDSEVYMYNIHSGRFSSLQRIRTDGAVDWEFFKIGEGLAQEYFLAVANQVKVFPNGVKTNEVDSVIYKWNWNVFVPFQCMKTYGASKWTAVSGINGEFILSITNLYGNTTFYSYDGWRFTKTKIQPVSDVFTDVKRMSSYRLHDQPRFLVQSNDPTKASLPNLFQVDFMKTFPKYELLESTFKAVTELNRTVYEELIPAVQVFNVTYESVKADVVFLNDNITFTDQMTFDNINVANDTIITRGTVETVNLSPDDQQLQTRLDNLEDLYYQQFNATKKADVTFNNVVTISTNQNITATKDFHSNLIIDQLLVEKNLNVNGTFNGIDISNLADNAKYINEDEYITEQITFNDVIFQQDVHIDGLVNDQNTSDYLTIDQQEVISGEKTFEDVQFISDDEAVELSVDQLVNGVNLDHLLLQNSNQNITATYYFNNDTIVKTNINVEGYMNDYDISSEAANTVLAVSNETQEITGHKRFSALEINGDLIMQDEATVNGIDVSTLKDSEKIHLSSDDMINATVVFASNVTVLGNLTVVGHVNGVKLDDVVFTNQPAVITSKKIFMEDFVMTNKLDIVGMVNGIDISENVLNTVTNQTISGNKSFISKTKFHNDLTTTALIDGVDLSAVFTDTVTLDKEQTISGFKTFQNLTVNNVTLKQCNGECPLLNVLTDLDGKTLRSNNMTVLMVNGTKTFLNGAIFSNDISVLNKVNDIILPADLLLRNEDQVIDGQFVFTNLTTLLNDTSIESLMGKNLSEIYEKAWRTSENTVLTGYKSFSNDTLINGNPTVNGSINGISLNDVVLSHTNQTVAGQKTFLTEQYIKSLFTQDMTVVGLIDGVNITHLQSELVNLTGNTIIKGTKVFERHISFLGNWSIPGLIDGVNLTDLDKNAMRLTGDQTVTGLKTFTGTTLVESNLTVSDLVDGVNLTNLQLYGARLDADNITFTEDITIKNAKFQDSLHIKGTVNNLNFSELIEDTLMNSGNQTVTGHHNIENLNASNIQVGLINNVNFSEEIIQLNTAGNLTGTKYFKDITVDHLKVVSINDIDIESFHNNIVYVNQDTVFSSVLNFENNLHVGDNITVTGLIDGTNLTHLISTTLYKTGNQTVLVPTHFSDVTFLTNVVNEELFNNINITDFSQKVFYKCHGTNKNITGSYSFADLHIMGDFKTGDMSLDGLLNGIDITALSSTVVTKTGNYTITGQIYANNLNMNNLTVTLLNGLSIPNDLVLLYGNSTITASKVFLSHVNVNSDVNMTHKTTLNGVDLSEFVNHMVSTNGNETIIDAVEFTSNLTVMTNMVTDTINNVKISSDYLLLKHGDQNVTGHKTFINVETRKDIISNNHIQGFDLQKMENETFISGRKNTVTGSKTINGQVTINGNLDTNFVDDANVTALYSGFNSISNIIDTDLTKLKETLNKTKLLVNTLASSIDNLHKDLDYFVNDQTLLLPYVSTSVDFYSSENSIYLVAAALTAADGKSCTNFTVFDNINGNFTTKYQAVGNAMTDVKFLLGDQLFLLTTSNRENDGCISTLQDNVPHSIIYRIDNTTNRLMLHSSFNEQKASYIDSTMVNGIQYIAFSNLGADCPGQTVYRLSPFSLVANISVCDVRKTIMTSFGNNIMLAIMTTYNTVELVHLDVTDNTQNNTQTVDTHYAEDLMFFTTEDDGYLVIGNTFDSSRESLTVYSDVPLQIYRYNDISSTFDLYDSVYVGASKHVEHFKIGIYHYLAVATYDQRIVFLKHKGISKWVEVLTVPMQGYGSIKDMKSHESNGKYYFVVLTDNLWSTVYPSKAIIFEAQLTTTVEGTEVISGLNLQ